LRAKTKKKGSDSDETLGTRKILSTNDTAQKSWKQTESIWKHQKYVWKSFLKKKKKKVQLHTQSSAFDVFSLNLDLCSLRAEVTFDEPFLNIFSCRPLENVNLDLSDYIKSHLEMSILIFAFLAQDFEKQNKQSVNDELDFHNTTK